MIKTPIILIAEGEPLLFRTADEAASYMEPVDVENRLYEAFDGAGAPLLVDVAEDGRTVTLVTDPSATAELGSLERRLLQFLRENGNSSARVAEDSLAVLLREFLKRWGYTV